MTPENNSKNTIAFVAIAMVVLIVYQMFVIEPEAKKRRAALEAEQAKQEQITDVNAATTPSVGAAEIAPTPAAVQAKTVAIDAPGVVGSLSTLGGRINNLKLKGHKETLAADSPLVTLFSPLTGEGGYYATLGWAGTAGAPDDETVWQVDDGQTLSVNSPVTLTYATDYAVFTRVIAVDDHSMFTITDTVTNTSETNIALAPTGYVRRNGAPKAPLGIAHEGFIGWLGDRLEDKKYKKIAKKGAFEKTSNSGWLGITDKYWMAALIPDQGTPFTATYSEKDGIYTANYTGQQETIAAGQSITKTERIFAGAKDVGVIENYAEQYNIPRFDLAVDWGMFWFFTKPFFHLLDYFADMTKAWGLAAPFGVAILMMTVIVKLVFFPLANKSYAAMSKMKKVQPQVDKLRKRYKNDFQKLNQEMMALYKREKINPMAGCLPIFIQIPVFFALYKVLFVSLEMRHAPFYGWVNDLSAQDPTTLFNLFGLLPFDPTSWPVIGGFLALGAWPVLMGLTMWLQQQMNPPAQDPMQRKIMSFLPIIFTFIMAPFAAGLVIYWTWSNVLSVAQQYWIMKKYKVDTPFDTFIRKLKGQNTAPDPDAD